VTAPSSFSIAAEQVVGRLAADASARGEESVLRRVADPARLQEAEAVAVCADRLADYEIEPPPHGRGVGRATGIAIIPPLRNLIDDKKLGRVDHEGMTQLRQSVVAPLAWGYLGLASVGAVEWDGKAIETRLDVDQAEVWISWVSRMFGGLGPGDDPSQGDGGPLEAVRAAEGDFDRSFRAVREHALEEFTTTIGGLGLMPKRLKRMRLKLVGQKYVDSGALLRLVQGFGASEDAGEGAFARRFVEESWPFRRQATNSAP
jgi:hypothetical protein